MKNAQKPPSGLSKSGKALWKSLQAEFGIMDASGLEYLTAGCAHRDRMIEAREIIQKEGSIVLDRFGQQRAHPACAVERDASASMLRCFRALNLDTTPNHPAPGRPPGGKF